MMEEGTYLADLNDFDIGDYIFIRVYGFRICRCIVETINVSDEGNVLLLIRTRYICGGTLMLHSSDDDNLVTVYKIEYIFEPILKLLRSNVLKTRIKNLCRIKELSKHVHLDIYFLLNNVFVFL